MTRAGRRAMGRAAAGAGGARAAPWLGASFAPASMQAPGRRGAAGARTGSVCSGGPGCVSGPSLTWVRSSGSRRLVGDLQAWSTSLDWAPEAFSLRVRLEETGEMFRVTNCRLDMTVRELKEELDLMAGIPFNLQRLQYLDQGVLMDGSTLSFHDVVPGGVMSLCIWHYDGWTELVLAAVDGDPSKLSCLGIGKHSFYCTPFSQHLEGAAWKQWTAQRAFVALYVTSHRGHAEAVQYLLEHGASCTGKTPLGRTPLHAAAAMGRLECINLLFQAGASIREKDAKGETPISIAHRLNRKQSARCMFLLHWMAKTAILNRELARRKAPPRGRTGIRPAASHHDSQGFGPIGPPSAQPGRKTGQLL